MMNRPLTGVAFDARWKGSHGIGRFATEVLDAIPCLTALKIGGSPAAPLDSLRLSIALAVASPPLFFSPGYNCPAISCCPIIVTIHDLAHIELQGSSKAKHIYYNNIMRPALKRAAAVLTVSEYFRDSISRWAGIDSNKIFNVGNGVSACFKADGVKWTPGFKYFLHVGNQKPHKNLARVLTAFHSSGLQGHFKMLCTGEPADGIKQLIIQLGLSDRVEFVGRISDEKLAKLYRGATALVFASLYEGFGIPIVEAMACGLPVITSTTTSMPEIAGRAAILVDPTNELAIATAMATIAESSELRNRLSRLGLERSKLFSWGRVAAKVSLILDSVLNGDDIENTQKLVNNI